MEATTAVCRQCSKRFSLSRRSNQHRAGGSFHRATRFCSAACKQARYRNTRNAQRPQERLKSAPATYVAATVTRPLEHIEIIGEFRTKKTTELRRRLIEIEVFGPHRWEDRTGSGGVPIQVSRLRPSSLVRR
jgi:hypothetical protein